MLGNVVSNMVIRLVKKMNAVLLNQNLMMKNAKIHAQQLEKGKKLVRNVVQERIMLGNVVSNMVIRQVIKMNAVRLNQNLMMKNAKIHAQQLEKGKKMVRNVVQERIMLGNV